jgi:hypothetical protein
MSKFNDRYRRFKAWIWRLKNTRTLTDDVEEIHRILFKDAEYRALLTSTYESPVEGSVAIDNIKAATMIREMAKTLGKRKLAREKLAVITSALGSVMRRYNAFKQGRR